MRMPVLKNCSEPECRDVAHTKGLCLKHYQAMRKAEKKREQESDRSARRAVGGR